MAAPYIIPFNFQPANTGTVLNGSYTVPSGKYARVIINLSAMARISAATSDSDGGEYVAISSNSDSSTIEVWAVAAEAFTTSTSSASGGPGASTHSISTASVSIGGTQLAIARAAASGIIGGGGADDNVTISGAASASMRYEEYNVIS